MIIQRIPKFISDYFRYVKHHFKYGHYQIFCWMLIAHSIYPGKQNVAELCRWTPSWILYKYMIRLLESDQWDFLAVFHWEWMQIYKVLPAPPDGILYLTIDKTTVDKTGKKGPASSKTKDNKLGPWKYGFQVVILMSNWGQYRFPVDFRVVRKKNDQDYKKPNDLFLEMLENFFVPSWATKVIVLGDSGFASKDNLKAIIRKNFYFVFSLARTWNFSEESPLFQEHQNIKSFVNQIDRYSYKKVWFKDIDNRRRTYWTYTKQNLLNVVGTVTLVISKKTVNTKPEKAKILVTNIPNIEARDVVQLYTRRWFVECLFKELKSGCGLGHHQVTKETPRVDRSVAMSLCTYLFILRFEYDNIPNDKHWSLLTLKHSFTLRLLQAQCEERNRFRCNKNKY